MIRTLTRFVSSTLLLLGFLSFANIAQCQYFTSNKGDLLLGFRKLLPTTAGTYELVVNIGNITNFEALAPGATTNISNYTPTQLSAAFSSYGYIQWSVFGSFVGSTAWAGFPGSTLWLTKARGSSQSTPPVRSVASSQQTTRQSVLGVGTGASTISQNIGTTNSTNNLVLVQEYHNDSSALTAFIDDPSTLGYGDFGGTLSYSIENTNPASFTSATRSDLYQVCPANTTDPITHLTTGSGYFVGYFQLNTDGTMSFTRASASAPPPPSPTLTVTRSANVSTISFLSTNGATYTLYFTNSAGLATPTTNWPSLPGTLSGNNSVLNFQDTTTASERIYRVKAQ